MPRKTPAEPVPNRLPGALRRRMRIGGLSLLATTGLLGTYIGYPGLRRAYAVTPCEVTNNNDDSANPQPGELRYCLDQVDNPGGGTITIRPDIGSITLDGDLDPVTNSGTFTITGAGKGQTIIDGDGDFSAFRFTQFPSTVYVSGLTIRNTFDETYYGPAVHVSGGELTLVDFQATYNTSSYDGGAVRVGSDVEVRDSTFTGNEAVGSGGALYTAGHVSVYNSNFIDNEALDSGGAIFGYYTTTISASTFTGNTSGYFGGAAYSKTSRLTATDSTFSNNRAVNAGAAFAYTMEISSSTFSANSATYAGGAIFSGGLLGDETTIQNSTVTGNSAAVGAAIYADSPTIIDFSTVVSNTNTTTSRAVVDQRGAGYDLSITNSIVASNAGLDAYSYRDLTISYSMFTSPSSFDAYGTVVASELVYGDPLLDPLADNGGPTYTRMPKANSPVIGRANPSGAPRFDQRGFTRTTNGLADMGSVETGGTAPEPDLSQLPPSWFQATTRPDQSAACPPGMHASWAEWPNEHTGGWTCEWTTWWDVNNGMQGGWVTTPGFNPGRPVSE